MKKTLLSFMLGAFYTGTAGASVIVSLSVTDFVAAQQNEVLDEIAGGSSWEITITDEGVTFTADVTVTGLQTDGGTDIRVGGKDYPGDSLGSLDHIVMRNNQFHSNNQNTEITLTVGNFVQTVGTGARISFDGITDFTQSNMNNNKEATIGAVSYRPNNTTDNNFATVTLTGTNPYRDTSSVVNGNTGGSVKIDATNNENWRYLGSSAQFSITLIPEPNTVALLALGGLFAMGAGRRLRR